LDIDRLAEKEGNRIKLDKVLLLADGAKVTVGKPYVDGARVMAIVKKNGKGEKIIVFKYKAKVRYRRKNGHRQLFTRLDIDRILPPGVEDVKPTKPAKKIAPKKVVEAVKPVAEATPTKAVEVTKPEAKILPKKTTKAVVKTPRKKTTTVIKPAAKRTPRKKKEEKLNGA
jgi:large subunit ribosomal protein L21